MGLVVNFRGRDRKKREGPGRREGADGLIRNSSVEWVKGFGRFLGAATSSMMGLLDGLRLTHYLGVRSIIIESDAKILSHIKENLFLTSLLLNCRRLIRDFQERRLEHVFREADEAADFLARMVRDSEDWGDHIALFDPPAAGIIDILYQDLVGVVVTPRGGCSSDDDLDD